MSARHAVRLVPQLLLLLLSQCKRSTWSRPDSSPGFPCSLLALPPRPRLFLVRDFVEDVGDC
jgi:hypothetical protein